MFKTAFALAALAAGGSMAQAATLEVGVGKKYSSISAAAAAANPYDTIIVYPGTYKGAVLYDANLTVRTPVGSPRGSAIVTGATVLDKGLFVTKGANIVIDGFRFTGAKSTSKNGAGIRVESKNLTVRNSEFISNQNGMLITPGSTLRGTVTITNSLFRSNGYGDGQSHGVYSNTLDKLVIENSRFENTKVGHHIKSRADTTIVRGSTILDGTITNAASYQIEVPEGGTVTIENNTLVKGKYSSNGCCSIALGFEQYKGSSYVNPVGPIVVRNNKFTNQRTSKTIFVSNRTTAPASLSANTLTGLVTPLSGNGSVNGVIN
jgi:hypothetical protein